MVVSAEFVFASPPYWDAIAGDGDSISSRVDVGLVVSIGGWDLSVGCDSGDGLALRRNVGKGIF